MTAASAFQRLRLRMAAISDPAQTAALEADLRAAAAYMVQPSAERAAMLLLNVIERLEVLESAARAQNAPSTDSGSSNRKEVTVAEATQAVKRLGGVRQAAVALGVSHQTILRRLAGTGPRTTRGFSGESSHPNMSPDCSRGNAESSRSPQRGGSAASSNSER